MLSMSDWGKFAMLSTCYLLWWWWVCERSDTARHSARASSSVPIINPVASLSSTSCAIRSSQPFARRLRHSKSPFSIKALTFYALKCATRFPSCKFFLQRPRSSDELTPDTNTQCTPRCRSRSAAPSC
ncbi:hypothetical protein F4781DRAFT_63197 [Annulohypoxylon bovei var. microspora]|nr:hypothetical protein F4781DRAFT_63197 [Annulohypoxylon bovei var. microspora]